MMRTASSGRGLKEAAAAAIEEEDEHRLHEEEMIEMIRIPSLPRLSSSDADPFADGDTHADAANNLESAPTEPTIAKLLDDLLFAEVQHKKRVAEMRVEAPVVSHSLSTASSLTSEDAGIKVSLQLCVCECAPQRVRH